MSLIKKARTEDAKERQSAYAALSTTEKVARLDARLGAGVGAKRERARLAGQS
jgi:hypothetical protein